MSLKVKHARGSFVVVKSGQGRLKMIISQLLDQSRFLNGKVYAWVVYCCCCSDCGVAIHLFVRQSCVITHFSEPLNGVPKTKKSYNRA